MKQNKKVLNELILKNKLDFLSFYSIVYTLLV